MAYYPLFLDLTERWCVVVGGGRVAARKAEALLEAGARVRVIAPRAHPGLQALADSGRLVLLRRPYRAGDLRGCVLAIAATDDSAVNRAVYAASIRRGIPCNTVDQPALCTFIAPAVMRRGDLVIAISTGGASPALVRRLRRDLEARIGPEYAAFVDLLRQARVRLRAALPDSSARKRALYRLVASPALDLLRAGRPGEARALVDSLLARAIRPARRNRG